MSRDANSRVGPKICGFFSMLFRRAVKAAMAGGSTPAAAAPAAAAGPAAPSSAPSSDPASSSATAAARARALAAAAAAAPVAAAAAAPPPPARAHVTTATPPALDESQPHSRLHYLAQHSPDQPIPASSKKPAVVPTPILAVMVEGLSPASLPFLSSLPCTLAALTRLMCKGRDPTALFPSTIDKILLMKMCPLVHQRKVHERVATAAATALKASAKAASSKIPAALAFVRELTQRVQTKRPAPETPEAAPVAKSKRSRGQVAPALTAVEVSPPGTSLPLAAQHSVLTPLTRLKNARRKIKKSKKN
eukprot:m.207086 g.207086  ORF g.207086 m.207086 type:complete len:306 (+) comp15539_c0_seq2:669-1586(+)